MPEATLGKALVLAKAVNHLVEPHGYFVALTGGLLYKEGPRKDIDLLLYKKRDAAVTDIQQVMGLVEVRLGLTCIDKYELDRFCFRFTTKTGVRVDILFPETENTVASYGETNEFR